MPVSWEGTERLVRRVEAAGCPVLVWTVDLLGGRNEWRYLLSSTRLWQLLAVRYVLIPDSAALPGYHIVMGCSYRDGL